MKMYKVLEKENFEQGTKFIIITKEKYNVLSK